MNGRRITAGVGVALMAAAGPVLGTAGPASADPPHDGTIVVQCGVLGSVTTQATTYGQWVHAAEPRLVSGSHQVLVAYKFHYVFVPSDGSPVFDVSGAKPAPRNGRLDVCTYDVDVPEMPPYPAGHFTATYWVSYTPA